MNKKIFGISAGVSLLALGAVAGIKLGNPAGLTLAVDHEHTDDCVIHHYEQVNPTSTHYGVKEYWICCTDSKYMLTKPSVSDSAITTVTHKDGFELKDGDKDERYIAPYVIPFDFTDGSITLNSSTSTATGTKGDYDGTLYNVKVKETNKSLLGMYVYIGNYGFFLRSGSVRFAAITSNGTCSCVNNTDSTYDDPRILLQGSPAPTNAELLAGTTIGLSVKKADGKATVSLYQNNSFVVSYAYAEVSNEISSSEAKFGITIDTNYTETCVISSPEA